TIATNMAGRGTDIMLGGNAEYLAKAELRRKGYEDDVISEATGFADTDNEVIKEARVLFQELMERYKRDIDKEAEKVREAGGLFIIGTERHESRRIDNQLRGRAGRQGDPGETKFFLSLEDDLMRLFGGDRIQSLMNAIGAEDDLPIEAKILTNSIENAQSKVEARNFAIRKNVLQYDDVMNRQREIIYAQRSKVLDGEDVSGVIQKMIEEDVTSTVDQYLADKDDHRNWNIQGLRDHYANWILTLDDLQYTPEELEKVTEAEILDFVLNERAKKIYASRESRFTPQIMREVERVVLLQNVDTKWMQHIDDMEELKRGIGLRGYAQRDPAVEYRIEGFEMFDAMILAIREDTVKMMYSFRLQTNQAPKRQQVAKPTSESGSKEYSGQLSAASQRRSSRGKVGRNDLCPCGSGKKYKKCCGRDEA
ncbi:MAG: preprotein translocase subunit SecA, partial [Oscillospiraceae bacterium]|nr:preprotein translocase subunit SecA [Oscillospiraceae bacterium]